MLNPVKIETKFAVADITSARLGLIRNANQYQIASIANTPNSTAMRDIFQISIR